MTKIIEVTECRLCPYRNVIRTALEYGQRESVFAYTHTCSELHGGKEITDMFTIPSWCPLPSKEDKK